MPLDGRAPAAVAGLGGAESTYLLLSILGREPSLQRLREAVGTDAGPERLADVLDAHGVQARPTVLGASDLPFLDLPALAQLRDETWVVLKARRRGRLHLGTHAGPRSVSDAELAPCLSGHALDLAASLPPSGGLAARVLGLLGHHRRTAMVAVVASLLVQLLALALPEITAEVMNRALPDGASSTLHLVAAAVLLVATYQGLVGWFRDRALIFLSARLGAAAERGLLEHILRLPHAFLRRKDLGEMLQSFAGFAASREILTDRALGALLDGVFAALLMVSMFAKLPLVASVVLGVIALGASVSVLMGLAQARQVRLEVAAQASQRARLHEAIAGIGTIKAAGSTQRALGRWSSRFSVELGASLRRQRLGLWHEVGMEALAQGLWAGALIWGGLRVLEGSVPVGTVFAFLQLSSAFAAAVNRLTQTGVALFGVRVLLASASECVRQEPEPRPALPGPIAASVEVILDDVWFRYSPAAISTACRPRRCSAAATKCSS